MLYSAKRLDHRYYSSEFDKYYRDMFKEIINSNKDVSFVEEIFNVDTGTLAAKYWNGIVGYDNNIYMKPVSNLNILKFDTLNNTTSIVSNATAFTSRTTFLNPVTGNYAMLGDTVSSNQFTLYEYDYIKNTFSQKLVSADINSNTSINTFTGINVFCIIGNILYLITSISGTNIIVEINLSSLTYKTYNIPEITTNFSSLWGGTMTLIGDDEIFISLLPNTGDISTIFKYNIRSKVASNISVLSDQNFSRALYNIVDDTIMVQSFTRTSPSGATLINSRRIHVFNRDLTLKTTVDLSDQNTNGRKYTDLTFGADGFIYAAPMLPLDADSKRWIRINPLDYSVQSIPSNIGNSSNQTSNSLLNNLRVCMDNNIYAFSASHAVDNNYKLARLKFSNIKRYIPRHILFSGYINGNL